LSNKTNTINDDLIVRCMHCGLCLPTCPTYALTGLEKSSPRGRIRLMKAVSDGELPIGREFIEEMNFCLDCQACETACPAGVRYGSLVESARAQISEGGHQSWPTKIVKRLLLSSLFKSPRRLELLARLVFLYQYSGLDWLLKKTGILRIFSKRMHVIQFLTPRISRKPSRVKLLDKRQYPTKPRFRVGFLTGCVMDVAFADVNVDTVELLVHHGCEVVIPPEQVCCGSLQAHSGEMDTARRLARRNVEAFAGLNLDAIVMNSAGCGAFMKEYWSILQNEPQYAAPAQRISEKVKDLSEFLSTIGLKVNGTVAQRYNSKRITYHDACHLVHSQRISEEPRKLIQSIPSTEYVELPEANWCCGSAGVYNITHYDTAMQLLDRKIENVKKISPDIIVTGNPGCLIQLEYGLRKEGMNVELLHLATFLRRVCCE
jgi:glycolate oxidase iron-sulfur subunit